MISIFALTFTFLILLVLEWRSRSRLFRVLALIMALGLFWFSRPIPYRELRYAMERAPVTQNLWDPQRKATPFESGLFTMYQEAQDDTDGQALYGALSFATLTWLALSPVLWRRNQKYDPNGASTHALDSVPGRAA